MHRGNTNSYMTVSFYKIIPNVGQSHYKLKTIPRVTVTYVYLLFLFLLLVSSVITALEIVTLFDNLFLCFHCIVSLNKLKSVHFFFFP